MSVHAKMPFVVGCDMMETVVLIDGAESEIDSGDHIRLVFTERTSEVRTDVRRTLEDNSE